MKFNKMRLIEYRIFMPLTVEENYIGQLWSFAEVSKLNTGGGEGVEILENQMFDLPLDENGNIVYKNLPEYEDFETQINGKSSSNKSAFKKSASKENFGHKKEQIRNAERSKSLDREDDYATSVSSYSQASANNNNNSNKHGQYTHKLYMIASKLPWFVRRLLPKDSTMIHEKSWNMYPVVKTVLTNQYFKTNGRIELDTITRECPNGIAEENVHNLTPEQLAKREVIVVDISDPISQSDYKEDEDPAIFRSKKTDRGPLARGEWISKQRPLICCYKLVFVEFKVFGLQTKAESYLKNMYKQLFTVFHRQVFCWIDKWYGLGVNEVRQIEQDLQKLLVKKIEEGELSKNCLADE